MNTTQHTLPFEIGEARTHAGLTLIPLFPLFQPRLEYVGLDEAAAHGLMVSEVGEEGLVELLLVDNPLPGPALLYEGEELVGAKQNRILQETILVGAQSKLEIPAKCVERGRWSRRSRHFQPAPRAAYPALRRAKRDGQGAVWADVAAKQLRLQAHSPTDAAEAMYVSRRGSLEEYVQAFPRLDGQSGVIVGIGGWLVCLDYVSRSDVFAGLYLKLLRGYALDALDLTLQQVVAKSLSRRSVGRLLGELELAQRTRRPSIGLGETGELTEYVLGAELVIDGEVAALSAFPAS